MIVPERRRRGEQILETLEFLLIRIRTVVNACRPDYLKVIIAKEQLSEEQQKNQASLGARHVSRYDNELIV